MKTLAAIRRGKAVLILAALQLSPGLVLAAVTDIANNPLATSANSNLRPNILFVLDDSGSMGWNYMPDSVGDNDTSLCFGYYAYNKVFYNPSYTYPLPIKADGTLFPAVSFTNAPLDGFKASSSKVDLSNLAGISSSNEPASYYNSSTKKYVKYYYSTLNAGKTADCTNSNYTPVTDSGSMSAAQKTNYANWYSYYRTRSLMMRSSAGRAFEKLTDKYRIGFTVISETNLQESANTYSLHIRPFDATQKQDFFRQLYAVPPGDYTPLRGALMKAGRYYAKKLSGQEYDPLEYSCQQNFTILSTDGFWNTNDETNSYGAFQLTENTDVGNQDGGSTPRPYLDNYLYKKNTNCGGQTGGSGKSNTLADVAMYYYKNDLRTETLNNCIGSLGTDVCKNNVPGVGDDLSTQQHMTLFTLGLGVDGLLKYSDDYKQGGSVDYNSIVSGGKPWPDPISCSDVTRIDDLWHAAVNGRGTYFSAKNPESLSKGLNTALSAINSRVGASAAAATSNLEPVAGDNFIYVALYRTVNWDGDLKAFTIDPQTGAVSTTALWSAQAQLDSKVKDATSGDGRTIYMFSNSPTVTSKLRTFTYANLTAESKNSYFDSMCGATPKLDQCTSLTATQQGMVSGANLVDYLRGQSTYEDRDSNTNRLFRNREHILGDMVNAVPVYLKKPPFKYADSGYSNFVTANASRAATVFVATNDGMLHAFDAGTGQERWSFVPTEMLKNLYKLADFNYAQKHQFFVDGSPTVADICVASCGTASATWKTILVGGFNAGGRGYYALDVTDPTAPKGLWEFTHNNLGFSFGNPVVAKNKAGTWVVLFSSGYNNVSPGDGNGHLFVVNAATGALIDQINTLDNGNAVGSTTTPSGLSKINAWVENELDNTAKRAYGGDLLGNLWRFDFDDNDPPSGKEAVQLATFNVGGNKQPITTKPELAVVENAYNVVFVGTGRYLGLTDLSNTEQQSIYGVKDTLGATGLGDVRQGSQLVKQTLSESTDANGRVIRTVSNNPVTWASQSGWYLDLNPASSSPGERVNVEMQQQYNILTVASNVPNPDACNSGGYGYLYNIDISTGGALSTAAQGGTQVGVRLSTNALVAGVKVVQLASGKTVAIVTDTTGSITIESMPSPTGSAAGDVKRTMWREITN